MTTDASLDRPVLEAAPGDEAVCLLEISNTGQIVESYALEVLGETAPWTVVDPPTLAVYPGTAAQVALRFRPPRAATVPAAELPYAVRVTPAEHPEEVAVAEGVLRVLPFVETTAEIVPRTSQGRRGGRHEVAVTNLGNVALPVAIAAEDPDDRLEFAFRPEQLTLGAGEAAFVVVHARPRRVLWRGHPVTLPFRVMVMPQDAPPAVLDAGTVQQPLLPRNLGRLVAALVVLMLLAGGVWYALLRPAVTSLAKEATRTELAPIARKADAADTTARRAEQQAAEAKEAAGGAPAPSPTASAPGSGLPGAPAGATAFSRRLAAAGGSGTTRTDTYTVPARRTLVITDIVLQNPQGDEGRLDLVVDGATVLTVALNNFRDLDYHLVSPIEVPTGRTVTMRITCGRPGPALVGASGGAQCRDFALLSGYQRTVARAARD